MPPVTPITSANPLPGQPSFVQKQQAPPSTQPPPPATSQVFAYTAGGNKPLIVRNRFTGEIKAVYGQNAQRNLDTGTWQPYGGQVYWRTTTPGERQADIVAANREKIQAGLEQAAVAYSAGQPVSQFYQRGFELPTSTMFTRTTTTTPAPVSTPTAQPTYLYPGIPAELYRPSLIVSAPPTSIQATPTERAISPYSMSFYAGSQKVSGYIGKIESYTDVAAKRFYDAVSSPYKPIYKGVYQLGRGVIFEAPKTTVETIGMIPGGVETIRKTPALLPTFAVTGTSQMISSTVASFKEKPLETIGTTIGTATIFSGVGKGIGKGVEISKPSLSTAAISLSEGVKLFREGQTVKVPSSFAEYPYPSPRFGVVGEILAVKPRRVTLTQLLERPKAATEKPVETIEITGITPEGRLIARTIKPTTEVIDVRPINKLITEKPQFESTMAEGVNIKIEPGAKIDVGAIKGAEETLKFWKQMEGAKTSSIPDIWSVRVSLSKQVKARTISRGATIGIAASLAKSAYAMTPVEEAIQRQKSIAKSIQSEQAILIPTAVQITPTISIQKTRTPTISTAATISTLAVPTISVPKIATQEILRIEPIFGDAGGLKKKLKFQFPSITPTEAIFRKRKRKTTKGFGKFPELARIATARQIIGGVPNLKFKAPRMSYKPSKTAVGMKLPSFKLASLTKPKRKKAKRRRR